MQGDSQHSRRLSGRGHALAGLVAGLVAVAACTPISPRNSLVPPPRPAARTPAATAPSVASQELAHYYQTLQRDLLTRGLLRTDGGGPETPYDADDLVQNFDSIAFYAEYAGSGADTAGGLARWTGPVRLSAEFGPSVPASQRDRDNQILSAYASRLARITGHPINTAPSQGNFYVIYAGQDDRDFIRAKVLEILPNISPANLQIFTDPPRSFYCLVLAGGPQQDPLSYSRGVALIRAEHPDLVRQSCVHEEIAQGLGLPNDSPRARPSIFNDDDEFALLTSHDEKLLTMLYDARLTPGLSAEQARPITRIIARELMGQPL